MIKWVKKIITENKRNEAERKRLEEWHLVNFKCMKYGSRHNQDSVGLYFYKNIKGKKMIRHKGSFGMNMINHKNHQFYRQIAEPWLLGAICEIHGETSIEDLVESKVES